MLQLALEAAAAASEREQQPSSTGKKRSYAESLAQKPIWRDLIRDCCLSVETIDFGSDVEYVWKFDAAVDPENSVMVTRRSGEVSSAARAVQTL
jgi:Flp pilus assembly protein TadG